MIAAKVTCFLYLHQITDIQYGAEKALVNLTDIIELNSKKRHVFDSDSMLIQHMISYVLPQFKLQYFITGEETGYNM